VEGKGREGKRRQNHPKKKPGYGPAAL